MRTSTIAISIVLHAALLLAAARARSSAPPPPRPLVEIEVRTRAHEIAPPPNPPPPEPPPPARLRHAPSATPATPPRAVEPPPAVEPQAPLPTGVELGNDDAVQVPRDQRTATPAARPTPRAPVQKELAATARERADEGCSEPPSKPVPRSKPSLIEYTPQARAGGVEGRLVLRVTVGASGQVEEVAVDSGVEATLDAAAVASVKTWSFVPARRCGKPVSGVYVVARRFELGD